MNTNSSPSLDHVSLLPRSTIMETKDKFDSFLKAALKETHKKSILTSDHLPEDENIVKISASENREFILNKFFEGNSDSCTINTESKPIPKPRTKILGKPTKNGTLSPPESYETFKVTTPKMVLKNPENTEVFFLDYRKKHKIISPVSSAETFDVKYPKILNTPTESFSDNTKSDIQKKRLDKADNKIEKREFNSSTVIDHNVLKEKRINNDDVISEVGSYPSRISKLDVHQEQESNVEILEIQNENLAEETTEDVMHLIIHKTDRLLLNSFVVHPVVKIHIVDINTGNYYPKKHKKRSVIYYYDKNLNYLPPIMTHPFNLQEQRSLLPMWEETILINEDFNYLATENENIIIFFEILDFMSVSALNERTKGWHKIAFAFLKIGKNNSANFGKTLRLQLYYSSSKEDDPQRCSIWEKWYKKKLTKYPSTLYITINKVKSEKKKLAGLRSEDALQEEIGTENLEVNNSKNSDNKKINISPLVHIIEKRSEGRSVDDITKLPNKCLAEFQTEEGCFTLKFSHNGLFLACAMKLDKIYSIVIYSVISFEEICYFPAHQGIIYSIIWSPDDSLLSAASADNTVSVWDVLNMCFLQILPHPYFVYTSDVNQKFIVTGCYDTVVRIWKNESVVAEFVLNQELKGHDGYITCVLFKNNHNFILSSDSVGVILEWSLDSNSWGLYRKISISDLKGTVINQIVLIGKEKRLVIHSRDCTLRILDLKTLIVLHWLHGGLNRRFHTSCSISPCGHFIIAGSENSLINIWNVKNGKYVGNLIPFENKSFIIIHTLHFNPKKNMLAVGQFGNRLPVLLFGYDEQYKNSIFHSDLIQGHKIKVGMNTSNREPKNKHNVCMVGQTDIKNVLNKFEKLMLDQLK